MIGPIVTLPPDDMIGHEVNILSDEIWSIPKSFSDLVGEDSGMLEIPRKIAMIDGVYCINLKPEDVQRSKIVQQLIKYL
jgi:hypothetical protein